MAASFQQLSLERVSVRIGGGRVGVLVVIGLTETSFVLVLICRTEP